jgi:hypothetical protein
MISLPPSYVLPIPLLAHPAPAITDLARSVVALPRLNVDLRSNVR